MSEGIPSEMWPVAIVQDRYGGTYSHGAWLAFSCADQADVFESGAFGGDTDAMLFWVTPPGGVGVGDSPENALRNLIDGYRQSGEAGPALAEG